MIIKVDDNNCGLHSGCYECCFRIDELCTVPDEIDEKFGDCISGDFHFEDTNK